MAFDAWSNFIEVTQPGATIGPNDITDALVYIDLSILTADWFAACQSGGADVRAADAAGNPLPFHLRDVFDKGDNEGGIIIKQSLTANTDETFRLYCGNAGVSALAPGDTYGQYNTYRNSIKGLWGFEQDPGGSAPQLTDYTINGNHGTTNGSMTLSDRLGNQWGNGFAWILDGIDDRADCGDDAELTFSDSASSDTPFTLTAWINVPDLSSKEHIISKYNDNNPFDGEWDFRCGDSMGFVSSNTNCLSIQLLDGPSGSAINRIGASTATNSLTINTWHHVAVTYDGSGNHTGIKLYIDGVDRTDVTRQQGSYSYMIDRGSPVRIGNVLLNSSFVQWYNGKIDEVSAIKGQALSVNEISLIHAIMNDAAGTFNVGTLQSNGIVNPRNGILGPRGIIVPKQRGILR